MTDSIIKLREQLVELSTDPMETRKLLDQLTEEEIDNANIHSPFHVGEKDIIETRDLEFAKVHKTKNGYLLHYHSGYSILVDDKNISAATALDSLLEGADKNMPEEEQEAIKLANNAVETIFRLPMFIFSHPLSTYTIAEIGLRYMLLLQELGEIPTGESDNPAYDKYIMQINEIMENFTKGLETEIQNRKEQNK